MDAAGLETGGRREGDRCGAGARCARMTNSPGAARNGANVARGRKRARGRAITLGVAGE
jgi:hypothetical protein